MQSINNSFFLKSVSTISLLILCLSSFSQNWIESQKIFASNRWADDQFGRSVAISGNYAIVGAFNTDRTNMSSVGSAYIYERNAAGIWNEVQVLSASDKASNDNFGWSVSISGDYAIVGAPSEDQNSTGGSMKVDAGSVYIFERDSSGVWAEVKKIVASDRNTEDYFGASVSISGDYAIVGANKEDENVAGGSSLSSAGSAYILKKNVLGNWIEIQKIVASDRSIYDEFGCSVAISGNYAVVGAHLEGSGSAYVFELNASGFWDEVKKLEASDEGIGDNFGYSVSISGDFIVIGAPDDSYGNPKHFTSGSAYIFERNLSVLWGQIQKITASDADEREAFGGSVSISGDNIIVGAVNESEDSLGVNTLTWAGAAYAFQKDGAGIWQEVKKIVHSDRDSYDFFGCAVSISGDYAIVGAFLEDDDTTATSYYSGAGSAYIFKNNCPQLDTSTSLSGLTIRSNQVGADYQWIDCNNANSPIPGATNVNFNATTNGSYAVVITLGDCSDTSACVSINNIGLFEAGLSSNITLSPNPNDGNFSIHLEKTYQSTTVTITDLTGRIIQSNSYESTQIINLLLEEPAGAYFITVENNNQRKVFRLVKY